MKSSRLLLIPVLAVAAACGGSGAEPIENALSNKDLALVSTSPDNEAILAKVYDASYQVPVGFFVDERAETETRSYTVHHVLDDSGAFELCSNDLVEAQAWEQADNDSRAVNGYYVTSIENDRYFEFVRELDYDQDVGNVSDPTSPGYARVFKCNYADRNGVDRNLVNGYAGRLSAASLDAALLRDFTEYLWQFRFFNVSRKVVIESNSNEDSGDLTQTLLLAFVVNQGVDLCDRVDVIEWRFRADPGSHEVTREFETIRSFEAEISNGTAKFCD